MHDVADISITTISLTFIYYIVHIYLLCYHTYKSLIFHIWLIDFDPLIYVEQRARSDHLKLHI